MNSLFLLGSVDLRDCGEKRLGVRMIAFFIELIVSGDLHHLSQVHHSDAVADLIDDVQVVGDEEVGKTESFFQILKQV